MVRMFVRPQVADYPTWRAAYDSIDGERKELGVTAHAVYQSVADRNDVTVSHDFDSREAAEAFTSSPVLRDAMQRAGVQGKPEIWFTTPV